MKKIFTLLILTLAFVTNVVAQNQNQTTYSMKTQVKEYIDFTGWLIEDHTSWNTDASITWNGNIVSSVSGTGTNGNPLTRSYTDYP